MPEQIVKEENVTDDNLEVTEETVKEDNRFDFSKRNKLKTKPIPAITMLLAGAVVSITTYVNKVPLLLSLELILGFMIVFLIVGDILKFIADRFVIKSEEIIPEDGEVIEKTPEEVQEAEA